MRSLRVGLLGPRAPNETRVELLHCTARRVERPMPMAHVYSTKLRVMRPMPMQKLYGRST